MTAWRAHRLFAGILCLVLAIALSEARVDLAAAAAVWVALVLYFWEELRPRRRG